MEKEEAKLLYIEGPILGSPGVNEGKLQKVLSQVMQGLNLRHLSTANLSAATIATTPQMLRTPLN